MKYILAALSLIVLTAGGYFLYSYTHAPRVDVTPKSQSSGVTTLTEDSPAAPGFSAPTDSAPNTGTPVTGPLGPARVAPAGQEDYRNEHYRFELFYPAGLAVKEYDEGNGARTISFENSANPDQGFEIFVLPYGQRQVSAERFKMDEPSGTIIQPTDVLIDNVRGTMFFGNNSVMGDTREVWFIRGGYLIEVSTYRALDAWLSQIMATWEFI